MRIQPQILLIAHLLTFWLFSGCNQEPVEKSSGTTPPSASEKDRTEADLEYQLLQCEMRLANTEKLYVVINFAQRELRLKLKGAVVWDYPMDIVEEDSDEVREFIKRFQDKNELLVRPVAGKYLFSAQEKNPDSVLTIVSQALKVNKDLLHRDVPERFQIRWTGNLILDIHTEISGEPKSILKNTIVRIGQALQRPFGEVRIIMNMDADHALTLYNAVSEGIPTLVYPPHPFQPAIQKNSKKQG